MTDDLDPAAAATLPDALYTLLPPAYRAADIAQGYPLLALSAVFDAVRVEIGDAITALGQAWFAETCPDAYVPLLGALVGAELGAQPLAEHRALVADLLGTRRRKGIAAALPRLIRGNSGWYAAFAPAADPGGNAAAAAWPLAPTDLPAGAVGTLRVWRRPTFPFSDVTPKSLGAQQFSFDPAGLDQQLHNAPNTPIGWDATPPVTALPAAITTAMLAADLAAWRAHWGADGPPDSLLYGSVRGLSIRVQDKAGDPWRALCPGQVRALAITGRVPPDYPALRGGAIAAATLQAQTQTLILTFGDASALLRVRIPAAPTMPALVAAVAAGIATAAVTAGRAVSAADVRAIAVGAAGSQLVLLPTRAASAALSVATIAQDTSDPLLLTGSAVLGVGAATIALEAAQFALLNDAPQDVALTFTMPDGQAVSIALPLASAPTTAQGVADALAAAISNSAVFAAGGQVVIVLASGKPAEGPPPPSPQALALGLPSLVAIDPERGLLALPSAMAGVAALAVDYAVAAPHSIGGLGGGDPGGGAILPGDGGDPTALARMLGTGGGGGIALLTSATRPVGAQLLTASWAIAGTAGSRPCIAVSEPGTLTLSGGALRLSLEQVLLDGGLALAEGDATVVLRDTTILPPAGSAAIAPADAAPAPTGRVELTAERCIVGAIDLTGFAGRAGFVDTVLSMLPAPDRSTGVVTTPADCVTTLERSTVIGGITCAGALSLVDSLCDGIVRCDGAVTISDSAIGGLCVPSDAAAITAGAAVGWCVTCGKPATIALGPARVAFLAIASETLCRCAKARIAETRSCGACAASCDDCPLRAPVQGWSPLGAAPLVVDAAYPSRDFATLSPDADPMLRTAAGNRDEVGAHNGAFPAARAAGFERALREGLLIGVRPAVTYES